MSERAASLSGAVCLASGDKVYNRIKLDTCQRGSNTPGFKLVVVKKDLIEGFNFTRTFRSVQSSLC